jgi:hypothetical protein
VAAAPRDPNTIYIALLTMVHLRAYSTTGFHFKCLRTLDTQQLPDKPVCSEEMKGVMYFKNNAALIQGVHL